MRLHAPLLLLLAGTLLGGSRAAAQGSPNIPLDDPRRPLIEYLIARGTIPDPSPMIRPFRRSDLRAALAKADTAPKSPDAAVVQYLSAQYADLPSAWWEVEPRGGLEAYTHGRRDLLRPGGDASVQPYIDLRLEAVWGPVVAVSRPAVEPRLNDDPDWKGRKDLVVVGRLVEGYLGLQFKWGRFWFGQFEQNYGPVGYWGIPISPYAYPRTYLGFDIGTKNLRLQAQAGGLRDLEGSDSTVIKRYHFMHRLGVRFSDRLHVALWETTVFGGEDRGMDGAFINPVSFLLLANQYGAGDAGNVMFGSDVTWRAFRKATLQAQLVLDDIQYENRSDPQTYPDRWAFTLAAYGPIGRQLEWRTIYTAASTLAFRTTDPTEDFVDDSVGIGRGTADMDYLSFRVTVPVKHRWAVTPDLTFQRQGAARLTDPFPVDPAAVAATPQILSDPVETTYRLGVRVAGRGGPLDLRADLGVHYRTNANNMAGVDETNVQGYLQAVYWFRKRGRLE